VSDIAIVTDSTSDLPTDWVERHDITVVPLVVIIDGTPFEDGAFTQAEYFERMSELPDLPTTSQPPVGAFAEVYERVLERASSIVSVHISSKLSGTLQSAVEAARQFGDRVSVFDSLNLSGGLGFVTMAAAKAASAGESLKDVMGAAERMRERVRLIVGFDDLTNLERGGRIGKVAKLAGTMLNVKPIIEVVDGVFEPLARARGTQAQLRRMLEKVAEEVGEKTGGRFIVLHAMAADRAASLRGEIEQRFSPEEIVVQEAGTVISTHTGTGIGIAFVP
jgi:DegV family protein with EDD domain